LKDKKYISILNKIKHKQVLLESIFPFVDERPFIFPYLLSKDEKIKKDLRNVFSSLQKNNKIPEINTIIYKFVSYRLLSETEITDYYELPSNWDLSDEWNLSALDILFEEENIKKISYIDYLKDILMGNFYKIEKDENIYIEKETIELSFPKGKQMNKFIQDYFSVKKILFIPYDEDFENIIKQIFEYLMDNRISITKFLFDKKYSEDNYEKYLKIFIAIFKKLYTTILSTFIPLLTLKFDGVPKNFKLHLK
jgi:hypothetical protein